MRLAASADLHGHIYKEFNDKSDITGSTRLDHIVASLSYIRTWCKENGINYFLFSGDLYHVRGRVDTVVFNAIYDEIEKFYGDGIEVIMIAGNHDQYDNSDVPENSIHAFKKLKDVWVYDTVGTHMISGENGLVELVLAPYSKNAQLVKDFIAGVEKKDIPQILLFHLGVSGAFVGSGNYPMADAFDVEDLRPDIFKYIIGGHFHKAQKIGGYEHVFYCGAPLEHSFGDEGEDKGFWVVDTSKRYDIDFVPIPSPKFHTITGHPTAVHDELLRELAANGDYVRFVVTPEQLEAYQQGLIPANLLYKVELRREYVEQERSDVKIGMGFEEIVSKYADENNPEAKEVGLELIRSVM